MTSQIAYAAATPSMREKTGTYVFNGTRGVRQPRSLSVEHMTVPSTGNPAYDETTLGARVLRWRHWGGAKAVGRGRITYCVIEYRPCRTYRGRIELTRRTADLEVRGLYTYDRARFVIPHVISTPLLAPFGN